MLLAYDEILELLRQGVVENASPELVNSTSLDITLGDSLLLEGGKSWNGEPVDFRAREALNMWRAPISQEEGYVLIPGEFILASSRQVFNLPLNISAELKLKSSVARSGITNLLAGWCDPGWHHSVMTLELQNCTRYHSIRIRPGDRIGQVVFFRHTAVPAEHSYKVKGRYNNDGRVEGIKL